MKSLLLIPIVGLYFVCNFWSGDEDGKLPKITGVNFVGTPRPIEENAISNVKVINADWIGLTPYSFCSRNNPEIIFNSKWQWWGEKTKGIEKCIEYAKANDIKIMIKPHIWVKGDGWAGELKFETEEDWLLWEKSYREYILFYAKIAQNSDVELFCIGTEIRNSVSIRNKFWSNLIKEIRTLYHGKLTYAANWDNYEQVQFWSQLDFIGIDAYFPIDNSEKPSIDQLNNGWKKHIDALSSFSEQQEKQILFTEYGYRSIAKCAGKHWEIPDNGYSYKGNADLNSQTNAYEALYQSIWNQPWFAGGFLWKWYSKKESGGSNNSDFTPQNKPVEKTIRKYYSK
ncbi:MAG: glycoside hydrolase TIM-barrel-like domain-containing protein [Flavobacteriales bacterium]|nr:glycoside hydrolase TIM-barrel-like domain-containing protein [Flavobacteriales bacterium]